MVTSSLCTPLCHTSFETLKKLVCTELKLALFDPECHTIVSFYGSHVGIGGVLSQIQNGREVSVTFGHHTLDARQGKYSTPEIDGLGAVHFTEYWEKFLLETFHMNRSPAINYTFATVHQWAKIQ